MPVSLLRVADVMRLLNLLDLQVNAIKHVNWRFQRHDTSHDKIVTHPTHDVTSSLPLIIPEWIVTITHMLSLTP